MIAGILLAAGSGTRFGRDKRLHPIGGRPLIYHALKAALDARLRAVYIVIGPDDAGVKGTIGSWVADAGSVHFVQNDQPRLGMMSSLKAVLKELPPEHEAAMVIHADMPLIPPSLIGRLVDEFERHGGIVLPECQGQWQHPRVIPRWAFEEFLALGDDERGTGVLERYSDRITVVPVQDHRLFLDIDSIEDVEQINSLLGEQENC